MNIYLDIDGTLVHEAGERAGEPAEGLEDFLDALRPHDTFWLGWENGDSIFSQRHKKTHKSGSDTTALSRRFVLDKGQSIDVTDVSTCVTLMHRCKSEVWVYSTHVDLLGGPQHVQMFVARTTRQRCSVQD